MATDRSSQQEYDTIIIGAGMSGLSAGIRLAHYDQRVCLLEKHWTIGGLNSFYRQGGRNYDVGLHAVTNFTPQGTKKGPLARLLRQLRFKWDDFELSPQVGSAIAFPGVRLGFTNEVEFLESEIARAFPKEVDGFRKMLSQLADYDDLNQDNFGGSARAFLGELFSEPMLIEMLLCPLMWYGNAREDDMDYGQFCIMFRSIFLEGFARPFKGVRLILKHLVRRFRALGGELRLRSGVDRIMVEGERAVGVTLEDGTELYGKRILSSAGVIETQRLCEDLTENAVDRAGQMTFIESISVLDKQPKELGFPETIVFFNDSEKFHWNSPAQGLCDTRTGVICSPNNYLYPEELGELEDGIVRLTTIADFDRWANLDDSDYQRQKLWWYDRSVASAVRFIPDFRSHVIDTDVFTRRQFAGLPLMTTGRYTARQRSSWMARPTSRIFFFAEQIKGLLASLDRLSAGFRWQICTACATTKQSYLDVPRG